MSVWATALRTAVGTVGRAIEIPMPAISNASMSSIQLVASEPRAARRWLPRLPLCLTAAGIGRLSYVYAF